MSEKIEAKVTHRFRAGPERVYEAILDPQKLRLWQQGWLRQSGLPGHLTASEIDPVVGGKFLLADQRDDGEARHWGRFKTLDRPKMIAFTWITDVSEEDDPALVTIIVEPGPDGTGSVVTLYNEMDAQWADWMQQTERGWINMLMAIDAVLTAEG